MKNMKKNKKLFIALILVALGGVLVLGIQHKVGQERQAELKRNREYEVSLVNALKNSYKDIKEIKISDPEYTEKPGSWSSTVIIAFTDGESVKYRIGHYLDWEKNYQGRMNGKTNEETNAKWNKLYSYKGKTIDVVKVTYSDATEGEQ